MGGGKCPQHDNHEQKLLQKVSENAKIAHINNLTLFRLTFLRNKCLPFFASNKKNLLDHVIFNIYIYIYLNQLSTYA